MALKQPKVSSYNVIRWIEPNNAPPMAGCVTSIFSRAGVAGTGVKYLGWTGEEGQMVALVGYSSASNRTTGKKNLNALKGSIVTVTDNDETQWTNLLVKDVTFSDEYAVGLSTGSETHFVTATFTLVPKALTY